MKTGRMKRILGCLIAFTMVFTLVSCNIAKNGKNGSGEIPTITYLLPSDPGYTFSTDSWIIKKWGEKTGVNIEINSPPRDSFNVKIAAMFASGQLPDMINYYQDSATTFYKQYGSQFFVALDEYLDKGKLPGLQKWLKKYPDIRSFMDHPTDKKLYGFPLVYDVDGFDVTWNIRNDILKKGNMDADNIKTLDDLKNAMLTLKKVSGQKYIASNRLGWNYAVGMPARFFGTSITMMYDNRLPGGTNQYIYAPAYPQYKKYIDFLNWMYQNEIMHPSFATMEQQELFAGYSDGKFLMSLEQVTMGMMLGGNDPDKYPDREEKVIFPVEIDGVIPKQPLFRHQNVGFRWPVTISKNSQHVDACMKAMDWLYTDEGINTTLFGQEGLHWEKDDTYYSGVRITGRQSYSTDLLVKQGKLTKEEYDKMPTGQDLGMLGSYWIMSVIPTNYRFNLVDRPLSIAQEKPYAAFIEKNVKYGLENGYTTGMPDPVIDFTKEEKDEIANISTTLDTFMSENSMKFITGDKPMSDWDSFISELEKLGYKKMEQMYNDKMQ